MVGMSMLAMGSPSSMTIGLSGATDVSSGSSPIDGAIEVDEVKLEATAISVKRFSSLFCD